MSPFFTQQTPYVFCVATFCEFYFCTFWYFYLSRFSIFDSLGYTDFICFTNYFLKNISCFDFEFQFRFRVWISSFNFEFDFDNVIKFKFLQIFSLTFCTGSVFPLETMHEVSDCARKLSGFTVARIWLESKKHPVSFDPKSIENLISRMSSWIVEMVFGVPTGCPTASFNIFSTASWSITGGIWIKWRLSSLVDDTKFMPCSALLLTSFYKVFQI